MDVKSFEGAPMVYNKNIFCYRDKGYNELTDIMKASLEVVKILNPDYKFIFLDHTNINEYFPYVDYIYENKSLELNCALFSDLLRVYLIAKYGGVWIDCSVFFSKSFAQLEEMMNDNNLNWFVFTLHNNDNMKCHYMISSFMASKSNNTDLGIIAIKLFDYIMLSRAKKLKLVFYKSEKLVYMDEVRQLENEGVFPYFLFHYMVNDCVKNNIISMSDIFERNEYIRSNYENFFGYLGFNKYNRRIYTSKLYVNDKISLQLLNDSELEKYKKDIVINLLPLNSL